MWIQEWLKKNRITNESKIIRVTKDPTGIFHTDIVVRGVDIQKDVIRHGHNGFLFEPGDDQELASLIAKALDDTDLRLQIGAQAKQDMKLRRWPAVADEVAIRLENLLNLEILHIIDTKMA